jgi:hypothetical protein
VALVEGLGEAHTLAKTRARFDGPPGAKDTAMHLAARADHHAALWGVLQRWGPWKAMERAIAAKDMAAAAALVDSGDVAWGPDHVEALDFKYVRRHSDVESARLLDISRVAFIQRLLRGRKGFRLAWEMD